MAFSEIEPFGSLIDDVRAGIGPAVAANLQRAPAKEGGKLPPPVSPLAFFPWQNVVAEKPADEPFMGTSAERAERIESLLMGLANPEPKPRKAAKGR